MRMDAIGRRVLLYDFYGELLTEHQREVYEDAVLNDLSLGEIAAEFGISRQGVHDMIRRCDKLLSGYEEKLHLVERFMKIRKDIQRIMDLASVEADSCRKEQLQEIRELSAHILEEL